MVSFTSLYSGSDKNASIFRYRNTVILIDCGGTFKLLGSQLKQLDLTFEDIDALLVTHTHSDHISALKMLIKYTDIPVYAAYGSHEDIFNSGLFMSKERRIIIDSQKPFSIKDIGVEAFSTPHDTNCSYGYNLFFDQKSASFATDLGHIPADYESVVRGKDFLFLESNHDVEMLKKSGRPFSIIQRILGKKGHLSNELSSEFSLKLAKAGLKRLMLGHLSGEANKPELAYRVTREKMTASGVKPDDDLLLSVAPRGALSDTVCF